MSFRPLPAFIGMPLLSLIPGLAQAQTSPALGQTGEATLLVVASRTSQDVPAQRQTPPAERVPQRFPANPSVHTYPRQADGHGIKLSGYNVSRWAEDWRGFADPKKRDDVLDRLKYLPLGSDDIYVTLSGEARLRMNFVSDPGLRDTGHRREDQLRLIAGADVHVGPLRLFGEVAHADQGGHNYGVAPGKSANDLIFTQAFAELSGQIGDVGLGVRYGRQEFTDGPSSLVTQLDNNSIRTSFNGVRGWAQTGSFRVDAFDFAKTKFGTRGTGDDIIDDTNRFSGVTFGAVLLDDKKRKLFLDPFVWRERNDSIRWAGSGAAREVRIYTGARLWGSLDKLTLDWTLDHQGGDFGNRDIDAWNFAIAQTYALSAKGWAPKLGIHFDYGSGGSYDPDTIRTAKGPAAGAIAFSYQGALNITNLFQVSPNVTVSPIKAIDLLVEYQRSWRASESDAVYRGDNTAYAGSAALSGSHVGDALRLQGTWKITPRLSFVTRYEYFRSGALLSELDYGNSHYLAGWFNFRF